MPDFLGSPIDWHLVRLITCSDRAPGRCLRRRMTCGCSHQSRALSLEIRRSSDAIEVGLIRNWENMLAQFMAERFAHSRRTSVTICPNSEAVTQQSCVL